MRALIFCFALILAGSATPLFAQTQADARITEWPLRRISQLGSQIRRHEEATRLAAAVLRAHFGGVQPEGMAGSIVSPSGADLTVRFLRHSPSGEPVPAWDVTVRNGVAGPVVEAGSTSRFSDYERTAARARRTATASVPTPPCSRTMNTVVLRDPTSDEWLVWLLTPPTSQTSVPIGLHYRIRVSADGGTLLSSEALTRSCLMLDRATVPEGGAPVALTVTHLVSNTPVETHVFQSLRAGVPIYVAAGDRLWRVDGTRITEVDRPSR